MIYNYKFSNLLIFLHLLRNRYLYVFCLKYFFFHLVLYLFNVITFENVIFYLFTLLFWGHNS